MPRLLLVGVVLATGASGAAAQEFPLAAGQRVRVTAPSRGLDKQVAQVRETVGDTLVIELAESSRWVVGREQIMRLPPGVVTRLDISGGRKSSLGKGALYGLVGGAAVGGVLGYVSCNASTSPASCFESQEGAGIAVVYGIAGGAAVGALLGMGIGALIESERWEEVPLDRVRLTLGPRDGGVGLGTRLSF
jgi:hypothetical protein